MYNFMNFWAHNNTPNSNFVKKKTKKYQKQYYFRNTENNKITDIYLQNGTCSYKTS